MKIALFVVAAGVVTLACVAAAWWGAGLWLDLDDSAPLSGHGCFAMVLGIGFTVLVGGGLMALVFFSSRHGYDDIDAP